MGWQRRSGHRKDDNHDAIVGALRTAHVLVWPIGRPCDLLCARNGRLYLLDVDGITKNRKRDQKQLDLFLLWGVTLVKTPEAALRAVGL